ncbi:Dabb family protein [Apibacter adventoris]|uniref:Stress responsive protein n=1 Tax=Apibacter adventoris TaxID=1679466 RepID=A0A2S8A941_9FLAO|nr:Dabb family protein [Apibacter adventoris]PQL91087.1 stress responsive protein [Apibacter adventoris]
MIHHIVMWKLKEADKKENARKIKKDLEALKNIIKELKFIQVSFNMDIAPQNNFDVLLDTHFNSFEELNIYANHPEHLKVVEFIKTVIDQRVAIDYEVN